MNHYLAHDIDPLIRNGRASSAVQAELLSAVAELHHLAGWIAHDMGDSKTGRAHLQHALRICREANNDTLAAEMLAGMSHQAAFSRLPGADVDLALAARQTASSCGIARLQAEAATMEAHGLAISSDLRGSINAMQSAERMFASSDRADRPAWLEYFDEAYIAAVRTLISRSWQAGRGRAIRSPGARDDRWV